MFMFCFVKFGYYLPAIMLVIHFMVKYVFGPYKYINFSF